MFRLLFKWLYRLAGWKVAGPVPHHLPKSIWVVAPHSSNWDFPVGVGARATFNMNVRYLAKKELFKWYSGWFFRALSGEPVDRSRSNNFVDAVAEKFNSSESLHICIAPEGTRSDVARLKTGFYYMALKAGVPLVPVGFDHPRKCVILGEPIYVTGDYQRDMLAVYEFFSQVQGVHKEWLKRYERTGEIA
ncbi:1-acyl-sn-glycerol-3-phosphate acyltransferase [Tellurirhabdus rosea]|uniref:1-acyl-sn-glycerol-3-phosphate acyltransferase n=1 Tax=Tellurirhabdus rosea TaxID=2674997 RepID=UPI002253E737|nr:1-acyl-sn-glycerol-3-phosphate acyltransferase [Tellurirhabdus rosea]